MRWSIIVILGVLAVSYVCYMLAFYNPNRKDVTYDVLTGEDYDPYHDKMLDLIEKTVALKYESVSILSYDRLKLTGRVYAGREGAPVHLQFHGYKGNGIRDFGGGTLDAVALSENVIAVDQRAHGKSEGHTITFGIKERHDVLSWVNYAMARFGADTPIIIEGISMGAATVLMASDYDFPSNVKGILADCPYSSPFGIVAKVAGEMFPLPVILYPFIVIGALVFGRFNIFEKTALKAVKNAKLPILVLHGTSDHFVPIEMSRELKAVNPAISFAEFPGAPHGLSYIVDKHRYRKVVAEFRTHIGIPVKE